MSTQPVKRRDKEATRRALLDVARELFAERGYAGTSINDVLERAGVSRGAVYHHFDSKQDLFRAVFEDLDRELLETIEAAAAKEPEPGRHLHVGCQAFLDACLDPAVQRIALVEAPAVLTWDTWREIEAAHALGLVRMALREAMNAGYVREQPLEPIAHMLFAALNEAGLLIARADNVKRARREVGESLDQLLDAMAP